MKNENRNVCYKSFQSSICKFLLTIILCGLSSLQSNAQSFTRSTFNDSFIPISLVGGEIESTATGDNANQTSIPIGVNVSYDGSFI